MMPKLCTIEGCNKPFIARGWCRMHYRRWRENGTPLSLHPARFTDEDDQRIRQYRAEGKTGKEIAALLGRCPASIASRVKTQKMPPLIPVGRSARNAILHGYQRDAHKHGRQWMLTDTQFDDLITQPCIYCGVSPAQTHRYCQSFVYSGIDRVDNRLGYIPENAVPCCTVCNYAKRDMSVEAFLAWINRVHTHQHA